MTGLVDSATAIMRMAERRLDVVAHNVANIATPGYKRRIGFAQAMAAGSAMPASPAEAMVELMVRHDRSQAQLSQTSNPFDLAISGEGYFRVRAGDGILYTRQGQFHRDADGLVVSPQGYVLQQAGGGDLVLDGTTMRIRQDGTVLDGERPIARIAIETGADAAAMTAVGESFYAAPDGTMAQAEGAVVRQGMLEGSNVTLGDEMTQSMVAVRQAESGARLIQLYDELIGRAVSAFGSSGK
ncbi:flagellar hook basal-body protein [Sphingomonas sanguinis]|uniref:flagellar hook-basal body protein n=1 Tax=Sphingomonas sanguinis TaxID=33051 RepID=UPI001C5968A4|nr:flagellar hook basal-body protein [Sphingomonas sanguinis]QXT34440.1 flagellar hook basal-body protein [Sphingomonas sanguinis]